MSETSVKQWLNPHNATEQEIAEQELFDSLLLAKYKALEELNDDNEQIDRFAQQKALTTKYMSESLHNQHGKESIG